MVASSMSMVARESSTSVTTSLMESSFAMPIASHTPGTSGVVTASTTLLSNCRLCLAAISESPVASFPSWSTSSFFAASEASALETLWVSAPAASRPSGVMTFSAPSPASSSTFFSESKIALPSPLSTEYPYWAAIFSISAISDVSYTVKAVRPATCPATSSALEVSALTSPDSSYRFLLMVSMAESKASQPMSSKA